MTLQELIRKKGRSKRLYSQAHISEEQPPLTSDEPTSKADVLPPQQETLKRSHQEKVNEEEKFIKLINPSFPEKPVIEEIKSIDTEAVFPIDHYINLNYDLTHSTLMNLIDLVRLRKLNVQPKHNTKRNFYENISYKDIE